MKATAIDQASVLLIDPSASRARRLVQGIAREQELELLALCKSLETAYNLTEAQTPDVVAISSDLTLDPGFSMYKALLGALGIECLILASPEHDRNWLSRNGKVVATSGINDVAPILEALLKQGNKAAPPKPVDQPHMRNGPIVVIGASTGGVEALSTILGKYPRTCPPTLVVQHIGHEFVDGFANRLNRLCPAKVQTATDGAPLDWGHVFIAPGLPGHLTISQRNRQCQIDHKPPVSGHRPSVDALFHSAVRFGPSVVAVLLTGMGRDGAEGMLRIHQAGGTTIAQDEDSCVVYGMPRVAHELGGVSKQLHIEQIGAAILRSTEQKKKGRAS